MQINLMAMKVECMAVYLEYVNLCWIQGLE